MGLTLAGRDDWTLLASGFGDDTGGGLFAYDGATLETVDRSSSAGLGLAGARLLRLLQAPTLDNPVSDLLVYDVNGVAHYHRLDGIGAPHAIRWDGARYLIVSTATNTLAWVSPAGEIVRTWQATPGRDAWHLNHLLLKDGMIFVSAFGRFTDFLGWKGHEEGAGFVLNLTTGEDVITGLSRPHNPAFFDGAWVVCNSGHNELLRVDPASGIVIGRAALAGFTRGIALADDRLFVGESAHRGVAGSRGTASIAVLDRRTWALLDRVALPCREISDLLLVPPPLLAGARRGFRTNSYRAAERDQLAMFDAVGVAPARLWATGDPLPPGECRVRIAIDLPATLEVEASHAADCTVENLGGAFFVSAPPHPVFLSYRWLDAGTGALVAEGDRTRLPRTVTPRTPVALTLYLQAPPTPGEYLLRVSLVQDGVAWFDQLDPANAREGHVRVAAASGDGG